jgi:hypothetical protein
MAGITMINTGGKVTGVSASAFAALGTGVPALGMSALGMESASAAARSFALRVASLRRPEIRDERPGWALGASVAAARGCSHAAGAGNSQPELGQPKHQDQQDTQGTYVVPATDGMQVTRRAFRGLEPWRERT